MFKHRESYRHTLNHFVIFPAVIELTLQQNMIELNRQTRRHRLKFSDTSNDIFNSRPVDEQPYSCDFVLDSLKTALSNSNVTKPRDAKSHASSHSTEL